MRFGRFSLLYLCALQTLPAAPSPAPAAGNLILNGGFEQVASHDNLSDGVDGEGFLAGERNTVPALTEEGSIGDVPMPLSINFADLNNDGINDLMAVDAAGFFRVWLNGGTKTEPKFTHCELVPLFLSRDPRKGTRTSQEERYGRTGIKMNLADWGRRGLLDLTFGNYLGEVGIIPNTGSAAAPEWRQPRDLSETYIRTTKEGHGWGNLFAPYAHDWNRDGRLDLLLGEGSYSANAIHLLLNEGQSLRPQFSEDSRAYLAFGDGREQLVPAVLDANGDGQPDLVVGDRKGTLSLYLSPADWKPGTELPFSSQLSLGRTSSLNGSAAPYAGDWNGDGLVDLIVGKSNGRIAVALNTGTKEQPKFDTPFEVKGQDVWGRTTMEWPADWSYDSGSERGNLYSYLTCIQAGQDREAAPPEGTRCLKFGYLPPLNRLLKPPVLDIPPNEEVPSDDMFRVVGKTVYAKGAGYAAFPAGTHVFYFQNVIKTPLKNGGSYQLSFKVKGRGVRDGRWMLNAFAHVEGSAAQVAERGGANASSNQLRETDAQVGAFSPGPMWTTVTKNFTVKFKQPGTRDLPASTGAYFELRATLQPFDGVVYVDDVELVQKN